MSTKLCDDCNQLLDLSCFPKDSSKRDGHINICKSCKSKRRYKSLGLDCPDKNGALRQKRSQSIKDAMLRKYGVTNASLLPEVIEKRKQTSLKKYGETNYNKSLEGREKLSKKLKEIFSDPIKKKTREEKTKKTNKKTYGKDFIFQTEEFKERLKKMIKDTYGVENISQSPDIKEKKKQTSIKNYGVSSHMQTEDGKNHYKRVMLDRYGKENPSYLQESVDKRRSTRVKNGNLSQLFVDSENISVIDLCKKYEKSYTHSLRLLKKYGPAHTKDWILGKGKERSSHETLLLELLKTYEKEIVVNSKKIIPPLELDLYFPNKKIGLEVNGYYFHSTRFKDKNYHLNKYKLAIEHGIQLLQFTDIDILKNTNLVKSMILAKLGIFENKIFARKCSIRHVEIPDYRAFLKENHIQGYCNANVRLGLYYNDILTSVMSFNTPRYGYKNNYQYELIRYSVLQNTSVVGGAKKLFKYFIKSYNPKSIISFCCKDYSIGTLYTDLGFSYLKDTEPSYFYIKDYIKYSREAFQKHKLFKKLKNIDLSKTEQENMISNGYSILYNCGNKVFTWISNP